MNISKRTFIHWTLASGLTAAALFPPDLAIDAASTCGPKAKALTGKWNPPAMMKAQEPSVLPAPRTKGRSILE